MGDAFGAELRRRGGKKRDKEGETKKGENNMIEVRESGGDARRCH